jgi:hypothetical protein
MRTPTTLCYAVAFAALLQPMSAQTDPHQQDRQALLKILSAVEKAINDQDIEGIIAQMSPDCTVTWWNAEISRGHDEIRAYYRRMVKDPGRIISKPMRASLAPAPTWPWLTAAWKTSSSPSSAVRSS